MRPFMLFFNKPIFSAIAAIVFLPLTLIYGIAISLRYLMYKYDLIKSFRPDIFSISVGNITVGGTGKTPVVIDLAGELSNAGFSPAVVTRGYGRKSTSRIKVTGETPVKISGDEPAEIFKKTGCTVLCDKDRTSAIRSITGQNDLVILDDAFQHLKVIANLNIVMIDERRFWGNKLLVPSGILRDRVSRLASADVIILSKVRDVRSSETIAKISKLKKYCNTILISSVRSSKITNYNEEYCPEWLNGKKIGLFCGIGSPDDFFELFEDFNIVKKLSFPDHYEYNDPDLILKAFGDVCDILITTCKDFVKLSPKIILKHSIYCLETNNTYYNVSFEEKTLCEHLKPFLPLKERT